LLYEGSVIISWYPVIEVLKTISPMVIASDPIDTAGIIVPSPNSIAADFKRHS